jgi:hypothetical protein
VRRKGVIRQLLAWYSGGLARRRGSGQQAIGRPKLVERLKSTHCGHSCKPPRPGANAPMRPLPGARRGCQSGNGSVAAFRPSHRSQWAAPRGAGTGRANDSLRHGRGGGELLVPRTIGSPPQLRSPPQGRLATKVDRSHPLLRPNLRVARFAFGRGAGPDTDQPTSEASPTPSGDGGSSLTPSGSCASGAACGARISKGRSRCCGGVVVRLRPAAKTARRRAAAAIR